MYSQFALLLFITINDGGDQWERFLFDRKKSICESIYTGLTKYDCAVNMFEHNVQRSSK